MALGAGDRLGPYEITGHLGAGGMGEVYRARDTRLDRSVAVKVLPEHIAQRQDARARFEREARAVASLNHPSICTLHDIGPNYMVMELIEGETLADRIAKGLIPLEQALTWAIQIADALDRAHRAGVTHRDIKPGNIMLTRDGVKVLDFGLAKSAANSAGASEATLTKAITTEGTVVGTPQYMAPEQLEGKEADARSDIWAFGAVLYEMVTGQKAFQGKNYTSLVAAILGGEPAPMVVNPFTPAWLERLVRRCLQKDAEDRWQTMRDVVIELKSPPAEIGTTPVKSNRMPWAIAAVLAAAVVVITLIGRFGTVAEAEPMEFVMEDSAGASELTISPDGKMLAWVDNDAKLRVRALDSAQTRVGADAGVGSISWSPDSRNIAYRHFGALKRLDVSSFTSRIVTQPVNAVDAGTAWTSDGHILIAASFYDLGKVLASGGGSAPVVPLNREASGLTQRFPAVLSNGEHFLYAAIGSGPARDGIYLARLDGKGEARRLLGNVPFRYLPPHALLVYENGVLSLVQFDPESGKISEPLPLAGDYSGLASFAISADGGRLAFVKGDVGAEQIALYDRSGKKLQTLLEAQPVPNAHLEVSPDGRRLLFERMTGTNVDVWTVELGRNVVSRLTFDEGAENSAGWSADGQKAYFRSERKGREGIYEISYGGAGTEKLIHKARTHHLHASPDGKHIMFERGGGVPEALDILDLATGKVSEYLATPASHPQFFPDSRYVAYDSRETGRSEVYVQTFPRGRGKWQISTDGGMQSRWRGDGKEIYYVNEGKVMAAAIETGNGSLEVTSTRELFPFRLTGAAGTALAVSADGKVFAIREGAGGASSPIVLKLNVKLPGR